MATEIGEIEETIAVAGDTLARDAAAHGKWHEVTEYSVYVYDAMGGGYGAIVNVITRCKKSIHLEGAELAHGVVEGIPCEVCINAGA